MAAASLGAVKLLAMIELSKKTVCGREKVFVAGKIVRRLGNATGEFRDDFGPIALGKRIEFLDQFLGRLRHKTRSHVVFLRSKLAVSPPLAEQVDARERESQEGKGEMTQENQGAREEPQVPRPC